MQALNSTTTIGLLIALGTGIAIGLQGLFTNITGQYAGALRGGVLIHIAGSFAGIAMLLLVMAIRQPSTPLELSPRLITFAFLAGTTGMLILTGIATAFPMIGQVAGQGALIFAQMAVAVVVDTFALAGGVALPLDGRRLLGLAVLALGTYLLLPRHTATS